MFGLKKYAQAKTKRFSSDKERKRHFAIQNYYANKNDTAFSVKTKKK